MSIFGEQLLLRIYLDSADRAPHVPTYERIVQAARREHLAGATVLRGILGTGYHGIIRPSPWSVSQHVPVIVEIVDSADRIMRFVQQSLDDIMVGGMLTLERAAVLLYRKGTGAKTASAVNDAPVTQHCPRCSAALPPSAASCPECQCPVGATVSQSPSSPGQDSTAARAPTLHLAGALKPLSTIPHVEPGAHMKINTDGVLLRVFIGESDRLENKPLYEAIVQKVRELGLAGATVLRGSEGFGANSVVHKAALLEMSTDLPIVIEVIDTEQKVQQLLPHLETMVQEGMITMEYVVILMYHRRDSLT